MNFRRTIGDVAKGVFCVLLALLSSTNGAMAQNADDSAPARPKVYSTVTVSYSSPDPAPAVVDPWANDPTGAPNADPNAPPRRRWLPRIGARMAQRSSQPQYGQPQYGQPTLAPPYTGSNGTLPGPGGTVTAGPVVEEIPGGAPIGSYGGTAPAWTGAEGAEAGYGPEGGGYYDGGEGGCGSNCGCQCGSRLWENFSLFGGADGFKGPPDHGINGNFGFHEGINWSMPAWDEFGVGFQIGAQLIESDFYGGGIDGSTRTQGFFTTGLFRRQLCGQGLQGGLVIDFMHDSLIDASLVQIRPEISWLFPASNEVGFCAAVGLNQDSNRSPQVFVPTNFSDWRANNWYALFYRRHLCGCGNARLWAGFTNEGQALLGFEAAAPISQYFGLQTSLSYVFPKNSEFPGSAQEEAFSLTVSLVWNLGYKSPCSSCNPYRPLFNVADNTTFLTSR